MPNSWLDQAACRNHPSLTSEAWFQVQGGYPKDQGAEALLVCRMVCPVRAQCREKFEGVEAIAGGGWWDVRSEFHEPRPGLFDVYMAAAYIGIDPDWVRRRIGAGRGFTVVDYRNGRAWFTLANVKYMARVYGPVCGSSEAYRLHHIRGDWPCRKCQYADEQLALTA